MIKRLHIRFLFIFVFIGVVPLVWIGLLLIGQQSRTLEQHASRELMGLARSLSLELDNQLTDMLQDACAFAAVPDIISMDSERQSPVLMSLLAHSSGYGQLAVADLSGQLIAAGREQPLVSIAHVPSFKVARMGEQGWAVFPALFGDDLILHMHTPIIDDDEQIVGVLGSPTSFPLLAESLKTISVGGGRAFVVDSNGQILIHSDSDGLTWHSEQATVLDAAYAQSKGGSGSVTYEREGVRWLAGFSRVPDFDWTIITERPETEVLQPAIDARNVALSGFVGTILLCLLIAYLMARSLTRPTREIAEAAHALGQGNPDIPLTERSHHSSEILMLIRSFNLMRGSVLQREQSLRQFHHAMAASIDGMAILENGRFTYVNVALAELYGVRVPADLIGEEWLSMFDYEERIQFESELKLATHREGVWQGELELTHPNQPVTYLDASLTDIAQDESILVLRDLTERRRSEERLLMAQKLESLGLMAGGIAHDFNNLLAAILGQAYVAKKKAASGSGETEHIERIIHSGRRAADLTRQLLAYAGKGHSLITIFDISELIRENIYILDTAIPIDVRLTLELSEDALTIEADKGQMQQIIMNLVINAVESISDGCGEVTLRTALCSDMLEEEHPEGATVVRHNFAESEFKLNRCIALEVHDTGKGMNRETVQRIFDPFYTTKEQGSGLGLSSTLGIVQSLGGSVSVCSEEGCGTVFRLLFPLSVAKSLPKKPDLAVEEQFNGTALIVDDEPSVRSAIQDVLETCGMTVIAASDGQEAVNLYRTYSHRIDLTLMDMRMPVLNGLDALKSIKSLDASARVVLMSGYTESGEVVNAIDNRTVFFMQKPYTYEQLMYHVGNVA